MVEYRKPGDGETPQNFVNDNNTPTHKELANVTRSPIIILKPTNQSTILQRRHKLLISYTKTQRRPMKNETPPFYNPDKTEDTPEL